MIHAQIFAYDLQEGGGPWYEYSCVSCGTLLDMGDSGLLEYLIRTSQQLFCDDCDPMPDITPPQLEGATVRLEGEKVGVPLVLFTTQSYA